MSEIIQKFISFSENLSPTEQWVVIALACLFFLYLVMRTMGLGGVLGFLLIGFFVYILYDHSSFKKFETRQENEAAHMKLIEAELQKN